MKLQLIKQDQPIIIKGTSMVYM